MAMSDWNAPFLHGPERVGWDELKPEALGGSFASEQI